MVHPVVVLFHVKHLPCQPAVSRETPLIRCSGLRRPLRAEAACRPVSDPDKGWPCRLRSCVVPAGGWKHIHAVVQIDGHECLALQGVVCCRAHGSTGRFGYGDRLPGRPVGGRRIGGDRDSAPLARAAAGGDANSRLLNLDRISRGRLVHACIAKRAGSSSIVPTPTSP